MDIKQEPYKFINNDKIVDYLEERSRDLILSFLEQKLKEREKEGKK